MDYHNFRQLDSDSEGEEGEDEEMKRSPSGSVSGIDIGSMLALP